MPDGEFEIGCPKCGCEELVTTGEKSMKKLILVAIVLMPGESGHFEFLPSDKSED